MAKRRAQKAMRARRMRDDSRVGQRWSAASGSAGPNLEEATRLAPVDATWARAWSKADAAVAGAVDAVGQIGRDDQPPPAADTHPFEAPIPPGNHLSGAEHEVEWPSLARRIEHAALQVRFGRVVEPAGVVDAQPFSFLGFAAGSGSPTTKLC